jgi:hypothetical protein
MTVSFNLSLLDIENCIRNVTLREDNLILVTFQYCFSPAYLGEEVLRVKRQDGFAFLTHRVLFRNLPGGR